MRNFKFKKEFDGRWFIELPEWLGDKEDLEMVCGADTLLDIISEGEDFVNVTFSLESFENYRYELVLDHEEFSGGLYKLKSTHYNFDVWLCYVTKVIFGELPKVLYVK